MDHDVIAEPFERQTREFPRHPCVERIMEKEICEQRRNRRPLWSTTLPLLQGAVGVLHRCFQPPLNVQHHPLLVSVRLHRLDDEVMRNVVEEPLDVKLKHPRVRETTLPARRDRIQRSTTRPVAVGVRMELRFHRFLQFHGGHRLGDPVRHSGHTKPAHPPAMWFRHLDKLHRGREIRPRGHPVPRHIKRVPQVGFEVLDRAAVHPRSALVRFHLPERFHHRLLRDRKRLVLRPRLVHWTPSGHRPVDHRRTSRMSRPLGSRPITGPSQLLRGGPPAGAASVLSP